MSLGFQFITLLLVVMAPFGAWAGEESLHTYIQRVRWATERGAEVGSGSEWGDIQSALVRAEKIPSQKFDRDELVQALIEQISDPRYSRISKNRWWSNLVEALVAAKAVDRPLAEKLLRSVEAHYAARPNEYNFYLKNAFDALCLSGPLDESLIDRILVILTPRFHPMERLGVLSRISSRFEEAGDAEKAIWAAPHRLEHLEQFGAPAQMYPHVVEKWGESRSAKYVATQVKKHLAPLRRFQRARKSNLRSPAPLLDRTELMREAKTALQRVPSERLEQCLRELEAIARRPVSHNAEPAP